MDKNKIYEISKVLALIAFGLTAKSITENESYSYCMLPLALAAGGIAASVFGRKKKAPAPPKPVDIFKRGKKGGPSIAEKQATGLFSQYYPTAIPLALQTSAEYGPQLMAQMFGQTGQFLGGVGGQPGFQELQRTTGLQAGQTLADLRAAEIGQQTGQAGLTRGLMEALSPEQAAAVAQANRTAAQAQGLESDFMGRAGGMMGQYGSQVGQYDPTISGANADVSRATQMAEESFARRGTLSPEEQRMAQQQAREAGAASGRLGGNAAIAAEIQNREAAKAARRGEAAQFGQQAFTQQLGAAGQQLAAEQALFNQDIAGGAQRAQERQLGFGQLMDIEQRRALAREEAAQAGQRSYSMAGAFYTDPGLQALRSAPLSYTAGQQDLRTALTLGPESSGNFDYNMPLDYASQLAGAQNQSNQANYQQNVNNAMAKAQMWQGIGSSIGGLGSSFGSGASGSNFASFLGGGNFGNAGTAFGNMFRESAGQPLRAYTV